MVSTKVNLGKNYIFFTFFILQSKYVVVVKATVQHPPLYAANDNFSFPGTGVKTFPMPVTSPVPPSMTSA